MFNRFFIIVATISVSLASAQTITPEKVERYGDTLDVYIGNTLWRQVRTPWAAGLALGYSMTNYSPQTESWLGDHGAGNLQFMVRYKHFELNGEFRLATINPKKNLGFGADTLDSFAKLNPVKLGFLVGYGFRPTESIILTPQIGYTHSSFSVINEDVLQKHFDISSVSGIALGGTGSFIIPLTFEIEIEFQISVHYHTANYSSVHPNLDNNYWTIDFSVGILEWFLRSEQFRVSDE